jgi:hypothetical protein
LDTQRGRACKVPYTRAVDFVTHMKVIGLPDAVTYQDHQHTPHCVASGSMQMVSLGRHNDSLADEFSNRVGAAAKRTKQH